VPDPSVWDFIDSTEETAEGQRGSGNIERRTLNIQRRTPK
jgi:hypothetical protein